MAILRQLPVPSIRRQHNAPLACMAMICRTPADVSGRCSVNSRRPGGRATPFSGIRPTSHIFDTSPFDGADASGLPESGDPLSGSSHSTLQKSATSPSRQVRSDLREGRTRSIITSLRLFILHRFLDANLHFAAHKHKISVDFSQKRDEDYPLLFSV